MLPAGLITCLSSLPIDPVCLCHSVNVEVAYTESLDIKTGTGPITLGFLDTMNGSASLLSKGGSITVNGLDGSANLQSHGGPIHVRSYNYPLTLASDLVPCCMHGVPMLGLHHIILVCRLAV